MQRNPNQMVEVSLPRLERFKSLTVNLTGEPPSSYNTVLTIRLNSWTIFQFMFTGFFLRTTNRYNKIITEDSLSIYITFDRILLLHTNKTYFRVIREHSWSLSLVGRCELFNAFVSRTQNGSFGGLIAIYLNYFCDSVKFGA